MTTYINYCQCYECKTGMLNAEIGEHDRLDSLLFPSIEEEEIEKYYLETFIIDDYTDDSDDSDDYEIGDEFYTDLTKEYYKENKNEEKKKKVQKSYAGVLRCDCGFFDDDIMY